MTLVLQRDALAAELGSVAARIERELRAQVGTLLAEVRQEIEALRAARAESELRALAAERALADAVAMRLAEVRDGVSVAGPAGPAGPMGRLPIARAWSEGVSYEGDVVAHAGSMWQAMRDTGRGPPHDDWQCLAGRGEDGRTPAFRGAWKPASAYQALDVVMCDGSSFIALCEAPRACPGDDWQMLARSGKAGPPGARGPQGERGYPGPPGASPAALTCDDEGMLTLKLGDGTRLDCDLYPVLAKLGR